MIRTFTRNVICLIAAIGLLLLMVCAVEVVLRCVRLREGLHSSGDVRGVGALVAPNQTTWIDVKPQLNLKIESHPGTRVLIQTNEHGLRGPSVIVPKPRGVFRIICLGGDNVFGSTVADHETLPGRLQNALNLKAGMPVEVINAGCPQAGPLINLLRYRARLAALQPDLVVLCLSEDDLSWDHDVRGGLHLDQSKNPAYACHPALNGEGNRLLDSLCREFVTVDWLLSRVGQVAGLPTGESKANAPPVRESLQRDLAAIVPLFGLISGNFGHLVVSVSPSAWSVDRARNSLDHTRSSFADDVHRFLIDTQLADRIEVQDGLVAFSRIPDIQAAFSPQTGGLSQAGNDLYAQQLAGFLLEKIPGLGATSTSQGPPVRPLPR